jgi:hypothetical protein
MMFSLVPAFSGMMALAFLPKDGMKWTRWGMYILQVFGSLPGLSEFYSILLALMISHLAHRFITSDLDLPTIQRRRPNLENSHGHYSLHRLLCR